MSSGANVLSRSYRGQQHSFMSEIFDTVRQLLATIKSTIGSPHFFLRVEELLKIQHLLNKYDGITFPSEEILSIDGLKGILDGY